MRREAPSDRSIRLRANAVRWWLPLITRSEEPRRPKGFALADNTETPAPPTPDEPPEFVTRAEGIAYCKQALAALSHSAGGVPPVPSVEYSRGLVLEHEAWLRNLRSKAAA